MSCTKECATKLPGLNEGPTSTSSKDFYGLQLNNEAWFPQIYSMKYAFIHLQASNHPSMCTDIAIRPLGPSPVYILKPTASSEKS